MYAMLIDRSVNPYVIVRIGDENALKSISNRMMKSGVAQPNELQYLDARRYGTERDISRLFFILKEHSAWCDGSVIKRFVDADYTNSDEAKNLFHEVLRTYDKESEVSV